MNEETNGNVTLTYVIFLFREEISSEDHNYARVFNCFRDVNGTRLLQVLTSKLVLLLLSPNSQVF